MTMYMGVDPGKKGALALLDSYGELLDVVDMPTVDGRGVQAKQVADIMLGWTTNTNGDIVAVIEDVHSMPKQGVATMFSFGRSKGVVEGVAAASGMRLVYVAPNVWKRGMRLPTKDKDSARGIATERWPKHSDLFKRKMDLDRAEAALIALWFLNHGST